MISLKCQRHTPLFFIVLLALFVLTACDGQNSQSSANNGTVIPANAIQVSIIWAPESERYLPQAVEEFNLAYAQGRDPLTGEALPAGTRPIYITGRAGSSGTVMQGIVNAVIAPNNSNVERPTIFAPSVSHWLALANYQSGRQIFDIAAAQPTALAPVVMAIWESRLTAIQRTVGYDQIGWEELLAVLNSPNGWQDFGIAGGRRTVYYGHTDPFISSTALSTLISEFYASARANGFTGGRLTLEVVDDPQVQQGVRDIEQLIRHYSSRTTEFIEYIVQGPDYLDFVALEENDLIYINQGKTQARPPAGERLVALYPKEGTFWHEHPFAIVNADWVTPEQAAAARTFTQYVLSVPVQQRVMEAGFRPANPDVPLGFPFVEENGVQPQINVPVLELPDPNVVAAIQQSWAFVKKQADVLLVIDISGSMAQSNKIDQARSAASLFVENLEPTNRVGLAVFNDEVQVLVPLDNLESNRTTLINTIGTLRADGGTALYDGVGAAVALMNEQPDENRIRAVVVLSDGQDTDSRSTLRDVTAAIGETRNALNPVIVITVAYGADASIPTLTSIAAASQTRMVSGDSGNILDVLNIIASYF